MTRINLVEPSELHYKHLIAEIHEITRVFGLVRKAQERGINRYNLDKLGIPSKYTMGTGHVKFFYNKLNFIKARYQSLCHDALRRGYKINPLDMNSLSDGLRPEWFGDYHPDNEAVSINKARILERQPK